MDKKDNSKNHNTSKQKKPSLERESSQDDAAGSLDEPKIYKKVRVNAEGQFKKSSNKPEEKNHHKDEKPTSNAAKKGEMRPQNHDRKAKVDISKSQKKKPQEMDRRGKDRADSKVDNLRKSRDKSDYEKIKRKDHSKEEAEKDKNRNKMRPQSSDQKNQSKKTVPTSRKPEKSADKEQTKQQKPNPVTEAKDEKKLKAKQKTDNERLFQDFAKKYPQYVYKGRFRFPIDDKLFHTYSSLLADYIPTAKRPKPKSGFIPPQSLGEILQIWNFFNSFPELFKCQDIKKEEIYASMAYEGEDCLLLLNDMHQGVLSIFLQEFIKKNRFETYKDETENPFFVLIKYQILDTILTGDELALIWTEFARKLIYLHPYTELFTETTKKFFEVLAQKTCRFYNQLEYRMKTRILISLIDAVYETDVFRDFLQAKMDATSILLKERNDLQLEIKQEETEYGALKTKVQQTEKGIKKEEQFRNQTSRLGSLRKQRDPEMMQKDLEKSLSDLKTLEESLNKKQNRLEEVNSELCMTMQTATFIGTDAHKSEYWVFQDEQNRVYVRHPQIVSSEEKWYYYDKKSELDKLIKSLNLKGIREKKLCEDLQDFIKNGKIVLEDDYDSETEQEKNEAANSSVNKSGKNKENIGSNSKAEASKLKEKNSYNFDEEDQDDDDDDGYVVRKKEDVDSKKKQEIDPEQAEKDLEKRIEEEEKTKEKLRELELEKQKEKKALREKRKLEEEQQLDVKYWFAKVKDYEASALEESEAARTARRQQTDQTNESSKLKQKEPSDLDIKVIKQMIITSEEGLNIYLQKWDARWAHPKIREVLLKRLHEAEEIKQIVPILLKLNEYFQYYETARGRRGRPQRGKDNTTGEQNKEEEGEGEGEGEEEDDEDDEDVDDEDEEDGEGEYRPPHEKRNQEWESKRSEENENENENENWSGDELTSAKRADDRENNEDMEIESEEGNQEKITKPSQEGSPEVKDIDREKEISEVKSMEEKREGIETAGDQKQNKEEDLDLEQLVKEEIDPKKIKRSPLKFWGVFNDRFKKTWVAFTSTVDNLAGLYFSSSLLCNAINSYVEKKTAKYFTLYKTGKEYMAARRKAKQEALAQMSEEQETFQQPVNRHAPEQMSLEYLENYRHNPRRIMTRANKFAKESQPQSRNTGEPDSIVARLRERARGQRSYREPNYEYKSRYDERTARVKLDELANLRRSVRLSNVSKKKYDNLNEQQWDNECKACGKIEGEFISCSTCSDTYHPECAELDGQVPEEEWTCADCLQKIASQRRTRSSTRKLQL